MKRIAGPVPRSVIAGLLATSLGLGPAAAAGEPPMDRYYGLVLVAVSPTTGEVEVDRECLNFTKRKICGGAGGPCGSWDLADSTRYQNRWTAEMTLDSDGIDVLLQVAGRTERAGKGSSIAGTLYAPLIDANAAVAGVQMPRRACRVFARSDDDES